MKSNLTKNWLHKKYLYSNINKALLSLHPGILMDIGCGAQPYRSMAESIGFKYLGLDMIGSEHDLSHAHMYGSALDLPIKSDSVDVVLSTQVLEHIFEPYQMIKETFRILRRGGALVITAPHIWGLHENPHDYYRYTKFGLEYLLSKSKFKIRYIRAMGGFWVTWSIRLSCYLFPERVKNKFIRLFMGAICSLIQLLGLALDKIHCLETETHNYIALAIKE